MPKPILKSVKYVDEKSTNFTEYQLIEGKWQEVPKGIKQHKPFAKLGYKKTIKGQTEAP